MRVTFVLPEFNLNGGIRVVAIYSEWLVRQGHQVRVIATRLPGPTWKHVVKSLLKGKGWPVTFDPKAPSHFDNSPVEHYYLPHDGPVTDADVFDGDVVIATWWATVPMVRDLSPSKGAKVHFVQGYEHYAGDPKEIDAVYGLPMAKIAVSNWLAGIVRDRYHREVAAVVPNAVDCKQFHAPPRGKQAEPTMGMFYAREHIKGMDLGLKAYHLAKEKLPNLRLVLLSNAPQVPEYPVPPEAEWMAHVRGDGLRANLARCDVWVWPSREEGFGLPLLEASACRTPVVAGPAGASPEILAKGGGILVPPESPEGLAEAVVKICSLPEPEWKALSDKALAAAQSLTWDETARQFEEALQKIVQNRG